MECNYREVKIICVFILCVFFNSCKFSGDGKSHAHTSNKLIEEKFEKYLISFTHPSDWIKDPNPYEGLTMYKKVNPENPRDTAGFMIKAFKPKDTIPLVNYISYALDGYEAHSDSFNRKITYNVTDTRFETLISVYNKVVNHVKVAGVVGAIRISNNNMVMVYCFCKFEDFSMYRSVFIDVIGSVKPL